MTTPAKRADQARDFPTNTCAASRHVQQIGEALTIGECNVLHENWESIAESMLSVVASLWEARTEIERLRHALYEVTTNGEWTRGEQKGDWAISKEVYETAREAIEP